MKIHTGMWPGLIVILFGLVAPVGVAGSAGEESERSGGEAPQRSQSAPDAREDGGGSSPGGADSPVPFTSASSDGGNRPSNPQLRTYNPRVNRLQPVDDPRERFPQPESPHERPIVWIDNSGEEPSTRRSSGGSGQDQSLEELLERDEILADQADRERTDDGNRIVFCNRKLLEMHIRRDCEMFGDVKPSPVPLRSAREARYAPCTVCYKPR